MSKPQRWDVGTHAFRPCVPNPDGEWVLHEDIANLELHPSGTAALMREMAELLERSLSPRTLYIVDRTHKAIARYKEMTDENG